jgi:hypothetical protein
MLMTLTTNCGVELARAAGMGYFRYRRWISGKKYAYVPALDGVADRVWVNWGLAPVAVRRVVEAMQAKGHRTPALILNSRTNLASSKVRSYAAFKEAEIFCPEPFESASAAALSGVRFLGRKDHEFGGRGIVEYAAHAVPETHDFYVPLLDLKHEFRIHVWQGEVIATQYKKFAHAGIVRNHVAGAFFLTWPLDGYIGEQTTVRAKETAIKAVKVLGLDFGAVDMAVELTPKGNRRLVTLEVNTAPGVQAGSMVGIYTTILKKLRGEEA